MRILIATTAVLAGGLALGACNVSKEGNAVTVQYDQNTAENTAADVGATAQNIAGDISNSVENTGDKLQNKLGNDGDDANASANTQANAAENK